MSTSDSDFNDSEFSPKRIKMKNGSGSRSGSPKIKKQNQKELINRRRTEKFAIIENHMLGFVDHTHFIVDFFSQDTPKLAIFAPRRFGKTSHLDMLKTFLTCVHRKTPVKKMNRPVEKRENYGVFKNTKIITDFHDDNCRRIVEKHLGNHPVIYLNLRRGLIDNKEDVEQCIRMAVHEAYGEHPYLMSSKKLTSNPGLVLRCQNLCRNWCSHKEYRNQELKHSLRDLAEFLYNHFDGAKVFLLVDKFDSIHANALEFLRGNCEEKIDQIKSIAEVISKTIEQVTEGNEYLGGALITGVSYTTSMGFSPLKNFTKFRFLDPLGSDFTQFYGATRQEVETLVEKFLKEDQLINLKQKKEFFNQNQLAVDKIINDLESRFGYVDKNGTKIFCMWSVLQYLESGIPEYYWAKTEDFERYNFSIRFIKDYVLDLIHGKTITFQRLDKLTVEDVLELQKLLNKKRNNVKDQVVLNFLMDQGYLSYAENTNEFKIPNLEIQDGFKNLLYCKVSRIYIQSCRYQIDRITQNDDVVTLQKKMLHIQMELNKNLKKLQFKNSDNLNEHLIPYVLFRMMNDIPSFEYYVDSEIKLNGEVLARCKPDFFLVHKCRNFCILWELKLSKDGKDKMKTSKYALEEARGKEKTAKGEYKDYMDGIKKLGRDVLVIGISVDGNFNVSISYASNDEPQIYCITDKENELHPEYYSENCIMVPKELRDNDSYTDTDSHMGSESYADSDTQTDSDSYTDSDYTDSYIE